MNQNPVLIIRIQAPEQFRRIARDLDALFTDFLRRSGEPFTVEQQWDALAHALAQGASTLFLVAFDQRVRPVGYLLAQAGYAYWRVMQAAVHQIYIKPGVHGVIVELERRVLEWATQHECRAISAVSQRDADAFTRRFRMTPHGCLFIRVLEEHSGQTSENRTDDHRPEPLPAV